MGKRCLTVFETVFLLSAACLEPRPSDGLISDPIHFVPHENLNLFIWTVCLLEPLPPNQHTSLFGFTYCEIYI